MTRQTLGHYRILDKIASGGMGEVFLAEDTRLSRQIALKLLPPDLALDPERRTRLTHEAKRLAALNHPNIVTVHSVEEAGGATFITMELVRGRTIKETIPSSGVDLATFFRVAIPLTDAIAAAHQHGVVHRDIKPSNVMIADDSRVKVLDFGIAKSTTDSSGQATRTATSDMPFAGTPAYMSPEQCEGKPVDARSDIFSLGVLFYEMLTGAGPFHADTPPASLAALLHVTPRLLSEIKPSVPRALARIVQRCLAKNPVDRYQSAIDLRHDLAQVQEDLTSSREPPATDPATRRKVFPAAALAAALLIAVAAAAVLFMPNFGEAERAENAAFVNARQITSALGVESHPTWSPDGLRVAYQAGDSLGGGNKDIWVAQVGGGDPVNLTDRPDANDTRPSWSPDGREIAFYSDRDGAIAVWVMPSIGGNPRKVFSLPSGNPGSGTGTPQWTRDGNTLIVGGRKGNESFAIYVTLSSSKSRLVRLPSPDGDYCFDVALSPDGTRFAYVSASTANSDIGRLWTVGAEGGEPIALTDGRSLVSTPSWSADGRYLSYASNRGGTMDLWRQRIGSNGEPDGDAVRITQGADVRNASFSHDGARLSYSRGGRVTNVVRLPILDDRPATWNDAQQLTFERAYIEFVDVSPDGRWLAISSDRRGNPDLWTMPAEGGAMTQLTSDPTPDWNPRWSPDGKQILFYAFRGGTRDIWMMPSGGGEARQLTSRQGREWFPAWSPDGRDVVFQTEGNLDSNGPIMSMPAAGGEPRQLTTGVQPEWSPDGSWLAFRRRADLYRLDKGGHEPSLIARGPTAINQLRFPRDGRALFYSTAGAAEGDDIWRYSFDDRKTTRMTSLKGRRGALSYYFAVDSKNLYITWSEDDGDIWIMDAASPSSR